MGGRLAQPYFRRTPPTENPISTHIHLQCICPFLNPIRHQSVALTTWRIGRPRGATGPEPHENVLRSRTTKPRTIRVSRCSFSNLWQPSSCGKEASAAQEAIGILACLAPRSESTPRPLHTLLASPESHIAHHPDARIEHLVQPVQRSRCKFALRRRHRASQPARSVSSQWLERVRPSPWAPHEPASGPPRPCTVCQKCKITKGQIIPDRRHCMTRLLVLCE